MEDLPSPFDRAASDTAPAKPAPPWRPAVLRLLRLMIDSYRAPERDGWCLALSRAQDLWGDSRGALIFADLAQVLGRMRQARQSPFGFGHPEASDDAPTRHEALFLQVIALARQDRAAQAAAVAALLCEANDAADYLQAVHRLAARLGQSAPQRRGLTPDQARENTASRSLTLE